MWHDKNAGSMHHTDRYSHHSQLFGHFGKMAECSFSNQVVVGSNPAEVTKIYFRQPYFRNEVFKCFRP